MVMPTYYIFSTIIIFFLEKKEKNGQCTLNCTMASQSKKPLFTTF